MTTTENMTTVARHCQCWQVTGRRPANGRHCYICDLPAWAAGEPAPECAGCGRHGQTLLLIDGECETCSVAHDG